MLAMTRRGPDESAPGGVVLGLMLAASLLMAGCGGGNDTTVSGLTVDERQVLLEGGPNFRDLGGYRTGDGRMVRTGMIYRSGELSELTDADLEKLHQLRIRTVVDFRSAYEVETRGPDRLPEGARSVALAIDPGDLNSVLQEALSTGDFSALPPDYLTQVNRQLIAQHTAQYSQLLQLLLEPGNTPLVLHCTHGKDRAGIGSAIVLMALGAPVETAREDYLLSNVYREELNRSDLQKIREGMARARDVDPDEIDLSNVEALYFLDGAYFDAAIDEMEERYGSVEGYIRDGLGIKDGQIAQLRERMLVF